MLHSAARRPKGLGWRYEAHLRGLELCNINLTTTDMVHKPFPSMQQEHANVLLRIVLENTRDMNDIRVI
jgi:hypothetical protein